MELTIFQLVCLRRILEVEPDSNEQQVDLALETCRIFQSTKNTQFKDFEILQRSYSSVGRI